ncbi:MAG: hydantoinase B/oxoprolinase family protein [Desulfovibrionaceae bacterium]
MLEVFKNRFSSIAEEMGVTLTKTAFSPNIKERRDLSCAVFDEHGRMIAQAAHIPVHLGSMPLSVRAAIDAVDFAPGDMTMLNDPYQGGTHLPDITVVAPVFVPGEAAPAFYVANRAHHADVGGMSPGSMPLSTSLFQEGVIVPPLKIIRAGELRGDLLRLFLANVRTPAEREGDFAAQFMANTTGVRRMAGLLEKYGADTVRGYARALLDYAETLMRKTLRGLPDGKYAFEDRLDDDGTDDGGTDDGGTGDGGIPIRLELEISGEEATLDFTASADQVRGSVNAVRAITLSAVLYCLRAVIGATVGPGAPTNAGLLRPVKVLTRPGSVLDAAFPAAVAGGNVETSQRVVDVVLGALAQAAPGLIPAASQGTMNNVTIGGAAPGTGTPFAYYETLAGGMGGSRGGPGESAVHSHMTNTLNTPVEALEYAYPFRVRRLGVRRGSGGAGANPGGCGLVREVELLAGAEVTVLSERRQSRPWGLAGGGPGEPGRNVVIHGGEERVMPAKFHAALRAGDRLRIETPGGGGWGNARADRTDARADRTDLADEAD